MEIQEYLSQQEKIYNSIFQFLDDESDLDQSNDESKGNQIIKLFKNENILENREKFNDILQIIAKISEQHHRHQNFIKRVETILHQLKNDIKQTYSNLEIYQLFKKNLRILYFLVKDDILIFDQPFTDFLTSQNENDSYIMQFLIYMYPKTKNFFTKERIEVIEKHLIDSIGSNSLDEIVKYQQIGENNSYICELIRNDSIVEFISYVNKNNLSLSSQIEDSIFESNTLLANNDPSLIEYAAFFGSIQIFNYLVINKVKLTPSLCIYAIHGRNSELIHILEENYTDLPKKLFEDGLKEAIKCHHNDIAYYILDNYIDSEIDFNFIMENFFKNILKYSFQYHNIGFLVQYFNNQMSYFYSCKYNYLCLLELLLKSKEIELNAEMIFIIFFRFYF